MGNTWPDYGCYGNLVFILCVGSKQIVVHCMYICKMFNVGKCYSISSAPLCAKSPLKAEFTDKEKPSPAKMKRTPSSTSQGD